MTRWPTSPGHVPYYRGKGYSDIWLDSTIEPITHYPPLLSLSLSVLGLLGIDPLRGARILNILLFGTNTALVGWLGWRMTREFTWAPKMSSDKAPMSIE